ncbi:hypothetical protein Y032_0140g2162 [Ancylostoma ceylanicum]|uniref:Uncharacterized protein n=1 Tax=Ancylostoma ceylanicum TaxID=53326 RepID=A0A016T472_9BILA|nr:hypothetical protein Y032_0140g2162 [Ancylostoma ceylanicum]
MVKWFSDATILPRYSKVAELCGWRIYTIFENLKILSKGSNNTTDQQLKERKWKEADYYGAKIPEMSMSNKFSLGKLTACDRKQLIRTPLQLAWGSPDLSFNLYLENADAFGGASSVELLGLSFRPQNIQNFRHENYRGCCF